MEIILKEVKNRKDLKTFIYLPEKIHAGHKNWVPPLYMEEWNYFNPKKNKSFSYCDTIIVLAFKGEKPVGRIMGIINNRYNEVTHEKTARFGYLETWEDEEVVHALLNFVEEWARKKGMSKLVGPYGFTDQDPEGLLIEGFENRATIVTYYNFEWMPLFVEKQGFTKDIDYFVYKVDVPKEFSDFYNKVYDRLKRKGTFRIVEFRKRKEVRKWVKPVLRLMNECYSGGDIYGYIPLEEKEMEDLAKKYMPIIDPRFIKIVMKEDELVAFTVGIPDMAGGIQEARGRLFPFGIFKIIRAAKRTKQLDLLLGAVKVKYRGRGLDVLMGVKIFESCRAAGIEYFDTHHEMESNIKVRAVMERNGGKLYKRYRIYKKAL